MKNVLLQCSFDDEAGFYEFSSPSGRSPEEVIFCIAALMKVFDRDGVMPMSMSRDLLNKYLTDPQYEEISHNEVN